MGGLSYLSALTLACSFHLIHHAESKSPEKPATCVSDFNSPRSFIIIPELDTAKRGPTGLFYGELKLGGRCVAEQPTMVNESVFPDLIEKRIAADRSSGY